MLLCPASCVLLLRPSGSVLPGTSAHEEQEVGRRGAAAAHSAVQPVLALCRHCNAVYPS